MLCRNCGKEYGNEMNFCPYCGTPKYLAGALDRTENISDGTDSTRAGETQAESEKQEKLKVHKTGNNKAADNKAAGELKKEETRLRKKGKAQIIKKAGIAVLASIALICGIVIFINVTDRSAEQFVEDVQVGNMTDAVKIYQRKLLDHEKRDAEAKQLVETNLTDMVAKYHKGEVSVDEAIEKIDAFAQFYYNETFPFKKEIIEAEMKETVDDYFGYRISYEDAMASVNRFSTAYSSVTDPFEAKIQQLRASQESFIQAEELMAQGNYAEAEDLYLAVIEEDRDYDNAAANAHVW